MLKVTCYPGEKDEYEKGLSYIVSICGTFFVAWVFN
tara:strand:+ start:2636 stop:2743 length:108 start_codon:yes stop_codon:yes gene_type:complete